MTPNASSGTSNKSAEAILEFVSGKSFEDYEQHRMVALGSTFSLVGFEYYLNRRTNHGNERIENDAKFSILRRRIR